MKRRVRKQLLQSLANSEWTDRVGIAPQKQRWLCQGY
jgi:hypothetical protein